MAERSHIGADGNARPLELLQIAAQYRSAAERLSGGQARGLAPFRLCALQAIELSLIACLVHLGLPSVSLRDMSHDFGKLIDAADHGGLALDDQTSARIRQFQRDYLALGQVPSDDAFDTHPNALLWTVRTLEDAARRFVASASPAASAGVRPLPVSA